MAPSAGRSIVLSSCFSILVGDACGSTTGMRPVTMKFAVVSTMASSTSMMSMNGTTLIVSNGRSFMGDLPLQREDPDLALEPVVDRDRDEGDHEPDGRRLERERKPDHDLADVGGGIEAEIVERQHDAQNRAEQPDIRRVGGDRRDHGEP